MKQLFQLGIVGLALLLAANPVVAESCHSRQMGSPACAMSCCTDGSSLAQRATHCSEMRRLAASEEACVRAICVGEPVQLPLVGKMVEGSLTSDSSGNAWLQPASADEAPWTGSASSQAHARSSRHVLLHVFRI